MSRREPLAQLLASRSKAIRETRKLSQPDVVAAAQAKGYKIDQGTISRIERKRFNVSLEVIEALAVGLGVSPATLLAEDEQHNTLGNDIVLQAIVSIWEHARPEGRKWIEEAARFVERGHATGPGPARGGDAATRLQASKPRRTKKPKAVRIPSRHQGG